MWLNYYFGKNKKAKQTVPFIKTLWVTETINSQSIIVLEKDNIWDLLRAKGTVIVTNWGSWYAKGCLYIKTDAVVGTESLFRNNWTNTSCLFEEFDITKKVVTTTLTSAEVLALNTTPISLVSAPVAWSYIIVDRITASIDFTAAAYATNTTMEFRYTNGSGTKVTADIASLLAATADKIQSVWGIETEITLTSAASVVATVATGDPVTWDSDVKVTIEYRILSI